MNSRLALRRISAVITAILLLSGCGTTAIESRRCSRRRLPIRDPGGAVERESQREPGPERVVVAGAGSEQLDRARLVDPATPSAPGGLQIEDVVSWAGGYVAVGETGVTDPDRNMKGAFLTAPDGLDWTVVQTADLQRSGEVMTHVFVVGGRLLAIAEGGGVDCPADTACPTPTSRPTCGRRQTGLTGRPSTVRPGTLLGRRRRLQVAVAGDAGMSRSASGPWGGSAGAVACRPRLGWWSTRMTADLKQAT